MKKSAWSLCGRRLAILLILFFLNGSAEARKPALTYAFRAGTYQSKPSLDITATFTGDKSGKTVLWFQNNSWGEKDLFRCIAQYQISGKKASISAFPDSSYFIALHAPGAKISITYTVVQDFEREITSFYRPLVQKAWLHAFSQAILMVPDHIFPTTAAKPTISLDWSAMPADWAIHNSYGSGQRKQTIALAQEALLNGVFTAGDFRVYPFAIQGYPVYFATRGQWLNFDDETLVRCLENALGELRAFWSDYDYPYFTVTFLPTEMAGADSELSYALNGLALHQSFAASATNNRALQFEMIQYLFHHELMHTWIGRRIRNTHEELQYWFSEGFTEYYTYKNMLREGILTPEQWALNFNNSVLKPHYTSALKSEPNSKIKDYFWTDFEYSKLPYRRGAIFAFWLDNQIKLKTDNEKSLDELMHTLLKRCVSESKTLTDELFLECAQSILGEDISDFFQKHILTGEPIDLENTLLINAYTLKKSETGVPIIQLNYQSSGYEKWMKR